VDRAVRASKQRLCKTGEVMPCTTTDPVESEGNVRERPPVGRVRSRSIAPG
jgi:hypothetical protein